MCIGGVHTRGWGRMEECVCIERGVVVVSKSKT